MPAFRDFLLGPWRAVLVLGVTQIVAWGALYYPPVLTAPLISADRGWSLTFTMAGLSVALLVAGLASPRAGFLIDRHGGHHVMASGSLLGAAGLVGLAYAEHSLAYLSAWGAIGVAIAASLYDPAFSTLGRIFGAGARGPITALTLAGGFASTVSWPVTYLLINSVGWRGTYLIYAAALAFVAAPLHAFLLPRERASPGSPPTGHVDRVRAVLPPHGWQFIFVTAAFAAYAFVPSGASAHLLTIFGRYGLDAGIVIALGALFGPAQVLARVWEMVFGRGLHPLTIARGAAAALLGGFGLFVLFGISVPVVAAYMVLFGMANGLMTIARGTVPLALFGATGYGHVMGRIGAPFLVMQALAPLVLAYVAEKFSDPAALAALAAFALVAFGCFFAIKRPG